MTPFKEWETFYVIVGSSAAALTGLQFVVMALIADIDAQATSSAVDAFATPTIVHFCAVLLLSAVVTAPWRHALGLVLILVIVGVIGVVYAVVIFWRARRQTDYKPVFEDWLFHVLLPGISYNGVAVASACLLRADPSPGPFVLGAAVLLLLFVAIHNAWDSVTYMVTVRRTQKAGD